MGPAPRRRVRRGPSLGPGSIRGLWKVHPGTWVDPKSLLGSRSWGSWSLAHVGISGAHPCALKIRGFPPPTQGIARPSLRHLAPERAGDIGMTWSVLTTVPRATPALTVAPPCLLELSPKRLPWQRTIWGICGVGARMCRPCGQPCATLRL